MKICFLDAVDKFVLWFFPALKSKWGSIQAVNVYLLIILKKHV